MDRDTDTTFYARCRAVRTKYLWSPANQPSAPSARASWRVVSVPSS
jgi:hypothetical protein